jgi:hypothetical protein
MSTEDDRRRLLLQVFGFSTSYARRGTKSAGERLLQQASRHFRAMAFKYSAETSECFSGPSLHFRWLLKALPAEDEERRRRRLL